MLQALATLMFIALALGAAGIIALLLHDDWDAVCAALGVAGRVAPAGPQPPRVRAKTARRAIMMRVDVPQRRAAA